MIFKSLLVFTITIRIILLVLPSFKIDMTDWQAWTARLVEVGPAKFYSPTFFADYFPGYLYFLWVIGSLFNHLTPFNFFNKEFELTLKFITTIFDCLTAFYIFKIVRIYQKKLAYLATFSYLANPALIFNSSIWGQVDGILTFFLILSTYNLVELRGYVKWSFAAAFSVLIKPQALAILPVTLLYLIKNFKRKSIFLSILILAGLVITASIPFFSADPLLGLFKLFGKTAAGYPYTSLYAFNFWAVVGWWQPDDIKRLLFSYQNWGMVLYFLFLFIAIFPIIKKRHLKNGSMYLIIALSLLIFFLFPTRVHERYLFPFFAFFLLAVFILKSLKLFFVYLFLSLIHLINLWYVYFYYNSIYNNPDYSGSFLFDLITSFYIYPSVITLICLFLILFYLYRYEDRKN